MHSSPALAVLQVRTCSSPKHKQSRYINSNKDKVKIVMTVSSNPGRLGQTQNMLIFYVIDILQDFIELQSGTYVVIKVLVILII